jgi:hypothetical protein
MTKKWTNNNGKGNEKAEALKMSTLKENRD